MGIVEHSWRSFVGTVCFQALIGFFTCVVERESERLFFLKIHYFSVSYKNSFKERSLSREFHIHWYYMYWTSLFDFKHRCIITPFPSEHCIFITHIAVYSLTSLFCYIYSKRLTTSMIRKKYTFYAIAMKFFNIGLMKLIYKAATIL